MPISILSVDPTNGEVNVPVQTDIEVLFDSPLDPSSIGQGSLFVESSDKEVISGPMGLGLGGPRNNIPFSNPSYHGFVLGAHKVEYYSTDGITFLGSSFQDTSGTESYYTKVTFTPYKPLTTYHPYQVYAVGTSSTDLQVGIASRSVFDAIPDVGNTGASGVLPSGSFSATSSAIFEVEILESGVVGKAKWRWRANASAWSSSKLTQSYSVLLQDDVYLRFSPEGTFAVNDSFSFLTKPREFYSGITIYNFTTGDAGSSVYPASSSTLVSTLVPPNLGPTAQAGLALDHTVPVNLECNLDENTQYVDFFFNKEISTDFDTNGIKVYIGPANGDTCIRSETSYNPNNVFRESSTSLRVYLQSPVPVESFGIKAEVV